MRGNLKKSLTAQFRRMLARFVENNIFPAFFGQIQIHAVGCEIGQIAACVYRQIRRIRFFKFRQFFLVIARHPAR